MEKISLNLSLACSHSWHKNFDSCLLVRVLKTGVDCLKCVFCGYLVCINSQETLSLLKSHPDCLFSVEVKPLYDRLVKQVDNMSVDLMRQSHESMKPHGQQEQLLNEQVSVCADDLTLYEQERSKLSKQENLVGPDQTGLQVTSTHDKSVCDSSIAAVHTSTPAENDTACANITPRSLPSCVMLSKYNEFQKLYIEYEMYCSKLPKDREKFFPTSVSRTDLWNYSDEDVLAEQERLIKLLENCTYIMEFINSKQNDLSILLGEIFQILKDKRIDEINKTIMHIFFGIPINNPDDCIVVIGTCHSTCFYPILAILNQKCEIAPSLQCFGDKFSNRLTCGTEDEMKEEMRCFWTLFYFLLEKRTIDTLNENIVTQLFNNDSIIDRMGPLRYVQQALQTQSLNNDYASKPNKEIWAIFKDTLFKRKAFNFGWDWG